MRAFTVALICCCVALTFGSTFREKPNPKAGEGKCLSTVYPELGELNYGEDGYVLNKCLRISCKDGGSISGHGCGTISPPEGCTLDEPDYTKIYPDCCPHFSC